MRQQWPTQPLSPHWYCCRDIHNSRLSGNGVEACKEGYNTSGKSLSAQYTYHHDIMHEVDTSLQGDGGDHPWLLAKEAMDQTSTTLSVSTSTDEDFKEDSVTEEQEVVLHHTSSPKSSRFVFKDDYDDHHHCQLPIRRLSQTNDAVVVLNTRQSLLVEETDTEGDDTELEDEEGNDVFDQQSLADDLRRVDLVHLNFRLEMEEHARKGEEVLSVPARKDTDNASLSYIQVDDSVSAYSTSILGMVDTLCFPSQTCGTPTRSLPAATTTAAAANQSTVLDEDTVHQDILQVLGCSLPPDQHEISNLWDVGTVLSLPSCLPSQAAPPRLTYSSPVPARPMGPHRPGPRERIMRLRQWRRERSPQVPMLPDRTYSVDLGRGQEERSPLLVDNELMYDSDPEMFVSTRVTEETSTRRRSKPCTTTPQRRTQRWAVRECMNQKWDLVWHTEKSSVPVRAWMERGTVVGEEMLEPALVWRHGKHAPMQLHFLSICRILAATPVDQRKASIVARPSCTLRLLTSSGDEYFLEAASPSERNEILNMWKTCIARFATLAVLEDLDNIQKEFFHHLSHSYVPDVNETMNELDRDARRDD